MDGFQRLPVDTLKLLFSMVDISVTVKQIEVRYVNSGRGRPCYPVRSMLLALLFMRFEAIPSMRKLCLRLEKRRYAREICEFKDRAPDHTTFSKFIKRGKPENIEGLFRELREQAFMMGIVDTEIAAKLSVDSTFIKAYSRRGRKGGISDRGARVGKTERRSYRLGWRAHTAASMSALPIAYMVRAANVNDKDMVNPLLRTASRLLKRYGNRISYVIADRQYYSADVFRTIRAFRAEPVIPHPLKVKDPLINLWVTKRFKVRGKPELVEIYKLRMAMERAFKAGKLELAMDNLRWRGAAKVRMHVAICYACIYAVAVTAHKIGRPDLANSIKTFAY